MICDLCYREWMTSTYFGIRNMPRTETHAGWLALEKSFPGDSPLNATAEYALPKKLIRAIDKLRLLSKDEIKFENGFRSQGRTGFWHGGSFACEIMDTDDRLREECQSSDLDRRQHDVDRKIQELLEDEYQRVGEDRVEIRMHVKNKNQTAEFTLRLRQGYVGWLVTCPQFRREAAVLEKYWSDNIRPPSQLPILIDLANGSALEALWGREKLTTKSPRRSPRSEIARTVAAKADKFLQRWGLERLCTWDLPIPAAPALTTFNQLGAASLSTGMSLFVPWYLLRHRNLTIYNLADINCFGMPLDHLDDWFEGSGKKWGADRYAKLLELYVYRDLSLMRRYPSRLSGKTEVLDQAFSAYWSGTTAVPERALRGVESVRKLRLYMDRRLRECATAVKTTLAKVAKAKKNGEP